ncbi:MAG: hypothetical protein JKY86_05835 [Gammaproteobacteria bacterium]|nr:hypothetical protein [Gammaproteobacteria bacterium]
MTGIRPFQELIFAAFISSARHIVTSNPCTTQHFEWLLNNLKTKTSNVEPKRIF